MSQTSKDYFWGCTLGKESKIATWRPNTDDDSDEEEDDMLTHTLNLNGACLGQGAKDELNVVEITAPTFAGESISQPLFTLSKSISPQVTLLIGFQNDVSFKLISGNGPVHISATHNVSLSADDLDDEFSEEEIEPVIAEKGIKRKTITPEKPQPVKKQKVEAQPAKISNAKARKEIPVDIEDDSSEDEEDSDFDFDKAKALLDNEADESSDDDEEDIEMEEDDDDSDEIDESDDVDSEEKIATPMKKGKIETPMKKDKIETSPKKSKKQLNGVGGKGDANLKKKDATPKKGPVTFKDESKATPKDQSKLTTTPRKTPTVSEMKDILRKTPTVPKSIDKMANFLQSRFKLQRETAKAQSEEMLKWVQKGKN